MVQEEITIMNHGILHNLHPAFIASSGIALAARIGNATFSTGFPLSSQQITVAMNTKANNENKTFFIFF